ncbi:MAG: ribosome biogenesis GTPase YlqF [Lachnospiraceae bacterium]|nr:ribosome biogenesis GTPase YlqF [Lachnospiraceae bacterium]
MQFQWYPGHMTKAKRAMQEDLKLIDVIVELVDARVPYSSKNPDIDSLANGKARILLMNKYDLADSALTKRWIEYYEEKGFFVTKVNSKKGTGIREVQEVIRKACEKKIERDRKRGILNRPIRAMIVGIPNVGKSTFINSFAKKACTKTGNKPGVTRGKQWIRLNKTTELLDTPGILWPKFEDQNVGLRLAYIGSIKDELYDIYELGRLLIGYLEKEYAGRIADFYEIENSEDSAVLLERIAEKRGFVKTGAEYDPDKAARCLVDDFRAGKIGLFTLERPDMEEEM